MENLDQLRAALVKADAAGDAAGAKILADHIRSISAPPAAAPAKAEPSLAAQAWDGTKNLGLGLVKGVLAPVDGAAQLLTNGMASAAHAVAPGSGADKWTKNYAREVNDINTDRENKYQAMTPGSVAAGVGNIIGQVSVPLKGTQAATRGASLGAKLISGGTTGAVVGAAQPVYGAGERSLTDLITEKVGAPVDYWSEKAKQVLLGGLLGGGLSTAAAGVGAVGNALRPLFSPKAAVGDQLIEGLAKAKAAAAPGAAPGATAADPNLPGILANRDPAAVLEKLRAAGQLVDGSRPTTAQVAGVPELVMAEKVLKNNPASRVPFEDRAIANNQARLAQLLSVAKTPQELQAAVTARAAESKPLYDAAKVAVLPVDDELTALLARPSAKAAIARGQQLAREKGETVEMNAATPAAGAAPSGLVDASGNPIMSPGAAAQAGSISGNMLQYLKMGLADLQSAGRTQGIGSHEARALGDTEGALQGWIEKNSPAARAADMAYAKSSQPINSMQVGQDLYGKISGLGHNVAEDVSPMLSQYRNALAASLKASPYGMEPAAQKSLEAIQSDLQRESISNSIKSSGSDTVFNLQAPNWLSGQLFGNKLDGKSMLGRVGAGVGGFLTGGPMGAAGGALGAEKAGQFVGNRVNTEFQKAMLDPEYFAKLLGDALERQTAGASTFQKLTPIGARGAAVGAENVIAPSP